MPAKRDGRSRKSKKKDKKQGLKEKVTELLELPKEIVLNVPKITMLGTRDLIIENYKGIIEYYDGRIRVNTGVGIIKITGSSLVIKEITSEDIMVTGDISSLEFLK
ncbi:MAG: sporulation protein YqfC [Acetivibrionales bacterium]|jgi:sporulation protein YqfC